MTHKIKYNPHLHTALAYRLMVETLHENIIDAPLPRINLSSIEIIPPVYLAKESDKEALKNTIINETGELIRPIILINPNASDLIPERRWDAENFVVLSQRLIRHFNNKLTLVITGSPTEIEKSKGIYQKIDSSRAVNLSGKTDLKQLFDLYSLADVLITNDSGPGHFASMTPIQNIVLFGPETPLLFGPLGDNTHIIQSDMACRPCVTPLNNRMPECNNNICMQSITVEQVFRKILEVV